jgi:hypothetical protein
MVSAVEINPKLIWDYDFSQEDLSSEYFREWYIARVLTRGGIQDIRRIGLQTIHDYFPRLFLPKKIRTFWEWFFSLPDIQSQYGHFNPPPGNFYS